MDILQIPAFFFVSSNRFALAAAKTKAKNKYKKGQFWQLML